MSNKSEKKRIKKFILAGSLIGIMVTTVGGFVVYDDNIDHTKEICPYTKVLNKIPNFSLKYKPCGIDHQIKKMKQEYNNQGVDDAIIELVPLTHEEIKYDKTEAIVITDDNGNEKLMAPKGYVLYTDDDGFTVARKERKITCFDGYGIRTIWGNLNYDKFVDDYSYDNEEILVLK